MSQVLHHVNLAAALGLVSGRRRGERRLLGEHALVAVHKHRELVGELVRLVPKDVGHLADRGRAEGRVDDTALAAVHVGLGGQQAVAEHAREHSAGPWGFWEVVRVLEDVLEEADVGAEETVGADDEAVADRGAVLLDPFLVKLAGAGGDNVLDVSPEEGRGRGSWDVLERERVGAVRVEVEQGERYDANQTCDDVDGCGVRVRQRPNEGQ